MLLLLLLLQVDLGSLRDRIESGDSPKSPQPVENKRHTNAHQRLTSQSPIGAKIPPSPPVLCFQWVGLLPKTFPMPIRDRNSMTLLTSQRNDALDSAITAGRPKQGNGLRRGFVSLCIFELRVAYLN